MTKRNIRMLSTGFLISGLLLTALQTVSSSSADSNDADNIETLEADKRILEEQLVQLELENEQLRAEFDGLIDGEETNLTELAETTEDSPSETTEEEISDEEAEEEDTSNAVTEYTIVVSEGQPSSVVASQLQSFGLITDFFEFNDYLEQNDLVRQVRPGEFTVNSDMNRTQLIEAIIR